IEGRDETPAPDTTGVAGPVERSGEELCAAAVVDSNGVVGLCDATARPVVHANRVSATGRPPDGPRNVFVSHVIDRATSVRIEVEFPAACRSAVAPEDFFAARVDNVEVDVAVDIPG